MTLDELVSAGFPAENWPEDLPKPGGDNILESAVTGGKQLFRFHTEKDGNKYAMEVVVTMGPELDPAEGVGFMLNQFAYLWRTNKDGVALQPDGSCRRINF